MEAALNVFCPSVDKKPIAEAFGRAAKTYDRHAAFQRDVGERLLGKMPKDLSGKVVLDLGCGTGYFSQALTERGAEVISFDLSAQMLDVAKQRCANKVTTYIQGDAESLPLRDNSVDYVFSSLALQWCSDFAVPLREIRRVIREGGQAFVSTLLDGSLSELKQAWGKIDAYQHVNQFTPLNQIKVALAQSDCDTHQLDLPAITVWYTSAFALMRDLKGIGATHVNGRSQGLTSRRALLGVEREYQVFRNHQGLLPATYQVCLGVIHL